MRKTPCFIVILAALTACGEAPEEVEMSLESENVQSQEISNGGLDYRHPAVGKVDGGVDCTGTLIGPSTVLTAAHCIQRPEVYFALDDGISRLGRPHIIPRWEFRTQDLALVKLRQPVTSVTPMSMCDLRGERIGKMPVILVGFGRSSRNAGDYGMKRTGVSHIVRSTWEYFDVDGPTHACFGDSGGPALMQYPTGPGTYGECVFGVSSWIYWKWNDHACQYKEAYTRPDGKYEWFRHEASDPIRWLNIPPARHHPVPIP